MPVHIGTSGWQYADWKRRLYPSALPQRRWLEHYGTCFETVEVNSAFYRLPEVQTFEKWRQETPDDFVFSVKASRYLTHIKRLQAPSEPVKKLLSRARSLKSKLGPILLQLPPNLPANLPVLRQALDAFPSTQRVAFEPRHESWFDDSVYAALAEHGAALCLSDASGRRSPLVRTADWGYLRFHEGRSTPPPCYGRRALTAWAERLTDLWEDTHELFVYFNNDRGGCAVRDAHRFALAVEHAGLTATRVPSAHQASLLVHP
jgi:uncharacterized protein YecE (DUF72 family)